MEISDFVKKNKIIALSNFKVSEVNAVDCFVVRTRTLPDNISVREYLSKVCSNDKRLEDSCKMVNENSDFLNRVVRYLSTTELLKLFLMEALLGKYKNIVLVNFDMYFMEKELLFFKKLFRKLVDKYDKSIVMFCDNVNFMFDLVDEMYLNTVDRIYEFDGKDLYNKKIYKYLDKPKIVDFIEYLGNNGKAFDNYTEMKELLKAIYREV